MVKLFVIQLVVVVAILTIHGPVEGQSDNVEERAVFEERQQTENVDAEEVLEERQPIEDEDEDEVLEERQQTENEDEEEVLEERQATESKDEEELLEERQSVFRRNRGHRFNRGHRSHLNRRPHHRGHLNRRPHHRGLRPPHRGHRVNRRGFMLVNSRGHRISPHSRQLALLLYHGGTVCDDYFSWNSAHAICRLLGFRRARTWTHGLRFRNIQIRRRISMDNVRCRSPFWSSCTSLTTSHNCNHHEDIFLGCR